MTGDRKRLSKILRRSAIITAIATSAPFMLSAWINIAPYLSTIISYTASASAKLSMATASVSGGIFKPSVISNASAADEITYPSDTIFLSDGSVIDIELAPEEKELPYNFSETAEPAPQSDENPLPYPTDINSNDGIIKRLTYSRYDTSSGLILDLLAGGQVRNCTSVSLETLAAESTVRPDFLDEKTSEPLVLIMHTHTTESYEPFARDYYDSSFSSRTTDNTKNIVAVGDKITAELEAAGIGVIHDITVHDYPQYNGAYERSRVTVEEILKKYPSIKIVLDIHRDALITSDGMWLAPVAEINGKNAAQIMIISGCDDGTMNMPNYMKNFNFACTLQSQIENDFPGLTRPILFDYRSYNQNLTTGSLLIEIGGHGNSLDEALYTGELVGKSLASLLKNTVY